MYLRKNKIIKRINIRHFRRAKNYYFTREKNIRRCKSKNERKDRYCVSNISCDFSVQRHFAFYRVVKYAEIYVNSKINTRPKKAPIIWLISHTWCGVDVSERVPIQISHVNIVSPSPPSDSKALFPWSILTLLISGLRYLNFFNDLSRHFGLIEILRISGRALVHIARL